MAQRLGSADVDPKCIIKEQQTTTEHLRDHSPKKLAYRNTLQAQIQDRILNVFCQFNILASKAVLRI